MKATPTANLQTVERALLALTHFSAREPEWGLTELADRLGISKSMAHRLLATLVDHGFVEQNPRTRHYRLGLRLLGLGAVVGDNLRIRRVALPHMEALATEVGETVWLTVVDHQSAVAVARVETRPGIDWLLAIGERTPIWAGATNKILLPYLPAAEQAEIIAHAEATGAADGDRLRAELAHIREQGWAFTMGEVTSLTAAVAVAIIGQKGELLGGLSVAGPAARFTPDRVKELVVSSQAAAMAIARHYQYGEALR